MGDEEGGQVVSEEADVATGDDAPLPPEAETAGWPFNSLQTEPPPEEIYGTTPFEPINEE
jgi:hypothetical protein